MKLVVIIPALNEEKTIQKVIEDIPDRIPQIDRIQVLVINDGSSDRTEEIAKAQGAIVINHSQNLGVGTAFATGIRKALSLGADIIVNIDGDGQFDPKDIPRLIEPILNGEADFTTCTRFARKELIPQMPLIKKYGNYLVRWIINWLTQQEFTDVSCGFRAYTKETALKLNLFGSFTYTQETFLDLVEKKVRIKEVPLKVRGEREFGKSRVAGSVFRYGLRAGSIILLALRDIKPIRFFGAIGLAIIFLGLCCGGFVGSHWLVTGKTSPYQSVLLLSALLLILGFLLIILALIAEMVGRVRRNQEELLFLVRKQYFEKKEKEE